MTEWRIIVCAKFCCGDTSRAPVEAALDAPLPDAILAMILSGRFLTRVNGYTVHPRYPEIDFAERVVRIMGEIYSDENS